MIVKIISYAVLGIDGFPVEVEVDISGGGLPVFDLIGLPDPSVREAKERVRSAIRNSGLNFPLSRITVNLAPADLKRKAPPALIWLSPLDFCLPPNRSPPTVRSFADL